ncbi:MAG: U32 family peptidase [Chitinophagaceae bacterium]|nr:U32 family peptidase [Chitinophagaceae bacterium]
MRTRSAGTFSINDIKEVSSICKANGIRSYITLNTVMYEHDMQLLKSILKEAKKQGIDAVIAADFSVINYCNELGIPLHISTQANVSNIESVIFFSKFADVIVLARELTLNQVKGICDEIKERRRAGRHMLPRANGGGHRKKYIGKGTKYYPKIAVGEFIIESGSLKTGDTLMITGPKRHDQRSETLVEMAIKPSIKEPVCRTPKTMPFTQLSRL